MLRLSLGLVAFSVLTAQAEPPQGAIVFSGDLGLKPSELRKALQSTRSKTLLPGIPGLWKGWRLVPDYSPAAVQSDVLILRALYYQHGYLDATVTAKPAILSGGEARIGLIVQPGPRYSIRSFNGHTIRSDAGPQYSMAAVCQELLDERRQAERAGVLGFAASLEFHEVPSPEGRGGQRWADLRAATHTGPAYRTGRIGFRGNHHFGDSTLRRVLLIQEGALLDPMLLRKSLARLNRTGWFEPLTQADVVVNTASGSDRADVTIELHEKQARHWSLSGPVGPLSVEGPLRFTLGSRLPAWGRGLFELSTYTVSANLMLFAKPIGSLVPFLPKRRFVQLLSLERPILPGEPWLSEFAVTPQLGWQGMMAGYAMAHARDLLRGVFETDRALTPTLPLSLVNSGGGGTLSCKPAVGKLDRLGKAGGAAVNLLFSFSPF